MPARRLPRSIGKIGFELDLVRVHERPPAPQPGASHERRPFRAQLREIVRRSCACGGASAASRPRCGLARQARNGRRRPPASRRACRCSGGRHRSRPRCAARERSAIEPDSAPMEMSSLISSPRKPIESANHVPDHSDRSRGGSKRIDSACTPHARSSRAAGRQAAGTRRNRSPSSVARSASTTGRPLMAVGGGAAMAGKVLEHRQDAAFQQPVRHRAPQWPRPCRPCRHRRGRRSQGRRPATGTSAIGRQSTSMPTRDQIGGDQAGTEVARPPSPLRRSRS